MSRIILHIGTHKTATTTLQDMFFHNRKVLAKSHVIYPKIGLQRGHHGLVSAWIPLPHPYKLGNPAQCWKRLIKTYAKGDQTLLISSEEFSRIRPAQVNMAQLRDMLSDFDQVTVICTLREQSGFIQSVYQQISTDRAPPPWESFLNQALQSRYVDGLALNYGALRAHLLTGFAADEIHFCQFEEAVRHPYGILGHFLEVLDLGVAPNSLAPLPQGNSNVSLSPLATLIGNKMTAPNRTGPAVLARISQHIALSMADQKTSLYSESEYDKAINIFKALNPEFEQSLAKVQPNFKISPPPEKTDILFPSQIKHGFWQGLIREFYVRP